MPRAPKANPKKVETLEQRLAKVQRDLRYARAQEKKQARADDARRKIISGALSEEHALKNPGSEFARTYGRLLKEYVRPQERYLFADVFPALLPADEAAALAETASTAPHPHETGETDATQAAE